MSDDDAPNDTLSETPPVAVFTMKEAAEVAGVSVSTLRRRRSELEAAGAVISSDRWRVPITSLEAIGLMGPNKALNTLPIPQKISRDNPPHKNEELTDALQRIRDLELENLELRHRAEMAEAIARERLDALNAERLALRMIVASPSTSSNDERAQGESSSSSAPRSSTGSAPRIPWWKRTFG